MSSPFDRHAGDRGAERTRCQGYRRVLRTLTDGSVPETSVVHRAAGRTRCPRHRGLATDHPAICIRLLGGNGALWKALRSAPIAQKIRNGATTAAIPEARSTYATDINRSNVASLACLAMADRRSAAAPVCDLPACSKQRRHDRWSAVLEHALHRVALDPPPAVIGPTIRKAYEAGQVLTHRLRAPWVAVRRDSRDSRAAHSP
jgi:hypothetical protein